MFILRRIFLLMLLTGIILNATPATKNTIERLYIATFARVADSSGLEYWLNSGLELEEIAQSFFVQDETKAKYPSTFSDSDFIKIIYENTFKRTVDIEGFDYWHKELENNNISRSYFILAVVNGAKGDDENLLANQLTVGLAFANAGLNDINKAKTILYNVTKDVQSVTNAICKGNLTEIGCEVPKKEIIKEKVTNNENDSDNVIIAVATAPSSPEVNTPPTNNTPIAISQSIEINEDTTNNSIILSGTDSDINNTLSYTIETQPIHGTLNGTIPNLTYTPDANYFGKDIITFIVNDGTVNSSSATVNITVLNVAEENIPPVAMSNNIVLYEDTDKNITLSGTDLDIDDNLTFIIDTNPSNGTLSGIAPNLTYTPNHDFFGSDNFKFKVNDGESNSTSATINITVIDVVEANNIPTVSEQNITVNEDSLDNNITLIGYDLDVNDTLTFTVETQPINGELNGTAPNLTYTPNPNYFGKDIFTFKVNDGKVDSNSKPFYITIIDIEEPNTPPLATAQSITISEDTTNNIIVLAGTDFENDNLTFIIESNTTNGTLSGTVPNLTYTPNSNYFGEDNLTFRVNDGEVDSNISTVIITITNVDEPNNTPLAIAQSITIDEDTIDNNITIVGTDIDGDNLTFIIETQPIHGVLNGTAPNLTYTPDADYFGKDIFTFKVSDGEVNSSSATIDINITDVAEGNKPPVAIAQSITVYEDTIDNNITIVGTDIDGDDSILKYSVTFDTKNGTLNGTAPNMKYTPNADYNGTDSFTFTVKDEQNSTSDSATVSIIVAQVNDAPEVKAQDITVIEDATDYTITLDGNDTENDILTYVIESYPLHGTLDISALPTVKYTPNDDYNGTDSFTFTARDGSVYSSSATITITVSQENDTPIAQSQSETVDEDSINNAIKLIATDADGNTINYTIKTQPSHGTLTGTPPNMKYKPHQDYNGTDSFVFNASDNSLDSNGTITITITPVNDAPIAKDQTITVDENSDINLTLQGTDVDNNNLTFTTGTPLNGTLDISALPIVKYTPTTNYSGTDSFSFKVSDGTLDSNATVSIMINDKSNPTVIIDGNRTTPIGVTLENKLWVKENITFRFKFSEEVKDFIITDINITNGIKGDFTGSGDEYYLVVTPLTNSLESITIGVEANVTQDISNNENIANIGITQTVNTQKGFITTWKVGSNESIAIGTSNQKWDWNGTDYEAVIDASYTYNYNYNIDWGDGTDKNSSITGDISHTYPNNSNGTYDINITGEFPRFYVGGYTNDTGTYQASKLLTIKQWGTQEWKSMEMAFKGCNILHINTQDKPNLNNVKSMYGMFSNASVFNEYIGDWDVSSVTNMNSMFYNAIAFNQSLNSWNVSKVTDMNSIFKSATIFNQDIGDWAVSKVTNMSHMFNLAEKFNQNLNSWDVSTVTNVSSMFDSATVFNQNLNSWDVSHVTDMNSTFRNITHFDGNISDWNVSNVINMDRMFNLATVFDGNISDWNVSNVTNMDNMFNMSGSGNSGSFDGNLSKWNVSKVTSHTDFNKSSKLKEVPHWNQ